MTEDRMTRRVAGLSMAVAVTLALGVGWLALYYPYVLHAFLHARGGYWVEVTRDDPGLSPSVQRALRDAPPASPGRLEWRTIRDGLEAGELAVVADGSEVDRIFLARIDPAKFRFEVRNEPSGDRDLDAWMTGLGAAVVINGSYYARDGAPATPVVSAGALLGPPDYDARAGAFVASAESAGIRDLARQGWRDAFKGARDAMVSYPVLVSEDGANRVVASQWLANRSFVGQDAEGNIILDTTADAFFSRTAGGVSAADAAPVEARPQSRRRPDRVSGHFARRIRAQSLRQVGNPGQRRPRHEAGVPKVMRTAGNADRAGRFPEIAKRQKFSAECLDAGRTRA
jgi:hypothetical protein